VQAGEIVGQLVEDGLLQHLAGVERGVVRARPEVVEDQDTRLPVRGEQPRHPRADLGMRRHHLVVLGFE
jgi:hypothetical protein